MSHKSYKMEKYGTTVGGAVADAFSEFESLREEMQEIVDNMSGANMEHLPKYETAETAVSELDEHTNEPDVPESLKDLDVEYVAMVNRRKGRGPSRGVRLSNAQAMLAAVLAMLDEKEDEDSVALREELSEHSDFDVEFPGMFG